MKSTKHAILIVDDEEANLQKMKRTFVDEFQVIEACRGDQALQLLRDHDISIIITDQRMPEMTGVELLKRSLSIRPDAVRIILTGYTEVEDLMDAINEGQVHRYITKPWEPFELRESVRQELERWRLEQENRRLAEELKVANQQLHRENWELKQEMQFLQDGKSRLIYESRAMTDLVQLVDRVVQTDSTVLIQGETGTGKELLARYVHQQSQRRDQPFVPVNCGAVPTELVESAFFGHQKGAFTGATQNNKGFFEMAHQGTLFLDEIGEAPLELQVKMLRVLQDGEILPVGGQKSRRIDVRVIASTNRNLAAMVENGAFRQDLFFRLNVFSVTVPPLRARTEDVRALARHFIINSCRRLNKHIPGLEEETLRLLEQYSWPGNVRELENEIERMAILGEPRRPIPPGKLSERIRYQTPRKSGKASLKEQVAELERQLILDALRVNDHNRSHAARSLGISRQTIIAKLKQYQELARSLSEPKPLIGNVKRPDI